MKPSYIEFIQDVLITLHMNLQELKERRNFAEPGELDHVEARIMAYEEVLSILRDSAGEFGIPKDEVGL